MLQAGKLRQRIAIEGQAQAQDSTTGDITITWTTFADNVPANIESLSAREFIAAQAAASNLQGKITIRYIAGITTAMRARDLADGTLYNIIGVLPDNVSGREYITLIVGTGLTDGS